jgi:hypothetical protein
VGVVTLVKVSLLRCRVACLQAGTPAVHAGVAEVGSGSWWVGLEWLQAWGRR